MYYKISKFQNMHSIRILEEDRVNTNVSCTLQKLLASRKNKCIPHLTYVNLKIPSLILPSANNLLSELHSCKIFRTKETNRTKQGMAIPFVAYLLFKK